MVYSPGVIDRSRGRIARLRLTGDEFLVEFASLM